MFYCNSSGTPATVNAAIAAMTSSAPGVVETPLLVALQAAVTAAVNNAASAANYSGKLQVLIRGGFKNGTTEFSARVNTCDIDAMGNVRMGGSGTRANTFTP